MLASSRGRIALAGMACSSTASPVTTIPGFLAPAFLSQQSSISQPTAAASPRRQFSQTISRPSKLGRTPVSIPPGVELVIGDLEIKKDATTYLQIPSRKVTVKGPLGELSIQAPPYITFTEDAAERKITLSIEDSSVKQQREMWGTTWAYLNREILGVSEGHTAILRLVGVGYRATVEERPRKAEYPGQKFVCLKLGFTHPVEEPVPMGVTASTPQPTRILLEGTNKDLIMQLAAKIRHWRRPEPYKGKGIFINDETIKLKQKKIK